MTLEKLIARYLDWMRAKGASPHTLLAYSRDLRTLVQLVGESEPAELLNAQILDTFVGHLRADGLSMTSIGRTVSAVRAFVKWAQAEGVFRDNFATAIRIRRPPQRLGLVPSTEEMRQMLDGGIPTSWPERDRLILELLYGSGLRNAELVALNLEDHERTDELIVHGKGKRERRAPLGEFARQALTAYLPARRRILEARQRHTAALIVDLRGERITTRSVARIVKQIAIAKGLSPKIHPHALRRAYGAHMLGNNANLSEVSRLLGHARLGTTLRYSGGMNRKRMRETYDRTFNR